MASAKEIVGIIRAAGYSEEAIFAAWPAWWSDEADGSPSAQLELGFSLSRNLGLDPRSLFADEGPAFVWREDAKFKHLGAETPQELAILNAFGVSIVRLASAATAPGPTLRALSAATIRESILQSQPFVRLLDLLSLCWYAGVPVLQLGVFPLEAKRMAALTAQVSGRAGVLLARESLYPAVIAYYLAHEIGHLALGHVTEDTPCLVDLDDSLELGAEADAEERSADAFALELLTGSPEPTVTTENETFSAASLANTALKAGSELQIEPGTLALCYGHATKDWARAMASLAFVYSNPAKVGPEINKVAEQALLWDALPDESEAFLRAVMVA